MVEFNPYAWDYHEDPYPTYAALREQAPAYYNEALDFWALSRHEDVLRAFKDWQTYSSAQGVALEAFSPDAWRVAFFLAMDPPRHDRTRSLVNKAFSPRRVSNLEGRMRELTVGHIERFPEDGRIDFIGDFAGKLPMDMISEMIGVPEADRDQLRRWVDEVVHRDEGEIIVPAAAGVAAGKLLEYYGTMVADRRKDPREDLLGALLQAEIDGDRLEDSEIVGFLFLMGVAGNETTTKLLGNAFYWGQKFPDQIDRARQDPGRIADFVEETARFDNSSQILYRTLARDVEVHGRTMKEGQHVALLVGAANRDERVFANPNRFDIDRDFGDSLSFGRGIHFCLGASLARMEGRICCEEILKRFDDYEIDEARLVRAHSGNVRGFSSMPMQLTRAS